jgi:hypothetical protein
MLGTHDNACSGNDRMHLFDCNVGVRGHGYRPALVCCCQRESQPDHASLSRAWACEKREVAGVLDRKTLLVGQFTDCCVKESGHDVQAKRIASAT